jgi:predicted nucleic acid-binding protein
LTLYLDSSVLVAALVEDEANHEACLQLLRRRSVAAWTHALAETYSTLTGGRLGVRVPPKLASELLAGSLIPRLQWIELGLADLTAAMDDGERAGVRGGALYDYLHLVAARKAGAKSLFTLNGRDFQPLLRAGDPVLEKP